jgi:hypothetical protein
MCATNYTVRLIQKWILAGFTWAKVGQDFLIHHKKYYISTTTTPKKMQKEPSISQKKPDSPLVMVHNGDSTVYL